MMYLNLPYQKVWIKKSFLKGSDNFIWAKDHEMIESYLIGVRLTRYEPPLFEVYMPEYNACYDKVLQCAIFNSNESPNEEITLTDIAWWDCLTDDAEIYEKAFLKNVDVSMKNRKNKILEGTYFFTLDFKSPEVNRSIDYTEAKFWSEHKQKNFFFDDELNVLCCGPNNKILWKHSSLGFENPKTPDFKVFDKPSNFSHETAEVFGETDNFDYSKNIIKD